MAVVVIVPAWMLADGAYVGVGTGDLVATGLALAVTGTAEAAPAAIGPAPPGTALAQDDERQPGFTTLRGRVECPVDDEGVRLGTVLRTGSCAVVPFAATPLSPGEDVVVSGWLTAEPYLWAAAGVLARAVPEGRREWRVDRVRCVVEGEDPQEIPRLPDATSVDPDAAYLLDLGAVG